MSNVFVIDPSYKPLNPVHPGRARLLLKEGKASVYRMYPFTLILKAEVHKPELTPLRLKLDPGSKTTGLAIVNDASGEVVFAAELSHRGQAIKAALDDRRALETFTQEPQDALPQATMEQPQEEEETGLASTILLESRIANILTWVARLSRSCPITAISMELVKFDLQQVEHPEISGVEYQQGTLLGYEVRAYLLEKWGRACSYCGAKDVPLQIEHIHPRARGGTDRVSNLCLACDPCNKAKGTLNIRDFLKKKLDVLKKVLAQAKTPLKDATAVNATRWALFERLKATGVPVECGSGGLTKFNRSIRELPKAHWIDATCVGRSTPPVLYCQQVKPLRMKATGHGRRKMCVTDKYGFPKQHKERQGSFLGYRTGDVVKAVTPKGTFRGRIAIRHRPSFRLGSKDIHPKYMRRVHRVDGYEYATERSA